MSPKRTARRPKVGQHHVDELQEAISVAGNYDHVQVHARRGHLYIEPSPDDPVARVTPADGNQFGLSFLSHTGRWEPMPVVGNLNEVGRAMVDMLGPYLAAPISERMDDPAR